MLTPKMNELLTFIDKSIREDGVGPNYDEMAAGIGLKAKSGIFRLVDELEERGFISRIPKKWRSIEVIRRPGRDRVSVALTACEGISTEALEDGVVGEMLEALEAAINQLGLPTGYLSSVGEPITRQMQRAIAKAKGES